MRAPVGVREPPAVDEIEITPAMLRAGALAWAKGDPEFDSFEEIAARIYREMVKARNSGCTA
jgi:hypothetical protein